MKPLKIKHEDLWWVGKTATCNNCGSLFELENQDKLKSSLILCGGRKYVGITCYTCSHRGMLFDKPHILQHLLEDGEEVCDKDTKYF